MKSPTQNPAGVTPAMIKQLIEEQKLDETYASFVKKAVVTRFTLLQKRGEKRKQVATLLQAGMPVMDVVQLTGACYRTVAAVKANINK